MMRIEVKRLAPTLRATEGIEVTAGKTGGRRWIAIRHVEEPIVQTVRPSPLEGVPVPNGDDPKDDGGTVVNDPVAPLTSGFVPEMDDGTIGDGISRTSSNDDAPEHCADCGTPISVLNRRGLCGRCVRHAQVLQ